MDRVHQVLSIYILVNKLNLDLHNNNEIIIEFGGGTGQMTDVLNRLQFKGKHIVYDLPLMIILQKYFVDKINIQNTYILDDEEFVINNGTNYLPCNQIDSEKYLMKLPNINFIATYSLTETDIDTHNKFAEYMKNFSRIYIVYASSPPTEDYINNDLYIKNLENNLKETHHCYISDNFGGNGNMFCAQKINI